MIRKLAYTITEVTDEIRLGRTKIYEEIASGNLIARKVGRRTLILSGDLERYLQNLPTVKTDKT